MQRNQAELADFEVRYRQKLHEIAATREGKGSNMGKGKGKGIKLEFKHTHADFKVFCPLCATIWRLMGKGGWGGHYAPFKRVSATWADYGEEEAPRVCLQLLWRQYNRVKGLEPTDCPHPGIF